MENLFMALLPEFKTNKNLTLGVELELQLVNLDHFNLSMQAEDLLQSLTHVFHTGEFKPEITCAMIEINSSIHSSYYSLIYELQSLRNTLAAKAVEARIGICGGGSHPFQQWQEQRIFPAERFTNLSQQYGYLAQQYTVFGQHIHLGCASGDEALYLCHALARYIPHFIALSATSPFYQGMDTNFDCSRLCIVNAFPLSGTAPWLFTWTEFEAYFATMFDLGLVKSMKDFYWDIRPKPEYGTVELRICDSPLTMDEAANIAAYAQILAAALLELRPGLSPNIHLTYSTNRFNASKFGLNAALIDPLSSMHIPLTEDIAHTCDQLETYADQLGCQQVLETIRATISNHENGAHWMRKQHAELGSLNEVVKNQVALWQGDIPR
jgi:glutamate---cysteine ligase / carboxylate-amine ligase